MEATIARSLPFANFGTTIDTRRPMITTTISSSINVKPLLWSLIAVPWCEKFRPLNAAVLLPLPCPVCGAGWRKGRRPLRTPPFPPYTTLPVTLSLVASRGALSDHSRVRSSGRTHVDTAGLDRALDGGIGGRRIPAGGGTGTHSHGVAAGRLEGNRTTAGTTSHRVHLSRAQGGGVGLVIAEEPFLRSNQVTQVRLHAGQNR